MGDVKESTGLSCHILARILGEPKGSGADDNYQGRPLQELMQPHSVIVGIMLIDASCACTRAAGLIASSRVPSGKYESGT